MELFNQVPSNFFGILASPNKEIYLKALLSIYNGFKSEWMIPRSKLVIHLIDQIDDLLMSYNLEENDIGIIKEKTSSAYAHLLIRKLKDTRWIDIEMGNSDFEEYITVPDYSHKIISVLDEIVKDNKDIEYNRFVYSTYSVLKLSDEEEKDYQVAINSAYLQTEDLFDQLKMLYNNIKRYHRKLSEHQDMNKILTEHFYDFKEELADKIYYPIKTFDSVHRFKTPILKILKKWLYSDEVFNKLADEVYARERQKNSVSEQSIRYEAIEDAKLKLVNIIDVYENIDKLLKEIDKRNTEYTKATFDRMDFLINTDRSVKGKIRELIKVLSKDESKEWTNRINKALDISPQSIVDENSLYTRRADKVRTYAKREKIKTIKDRKAVLKATDDFKTAVKDTYSNKKIQEYILSLLEESCPLKAEEMPLRSDREYIKSILGVLGANDKNTKYIIDFLDGEVNKEKYRIPDFIVERKVKND